MRGKPSHRGGFVSVEVNKIVIHLKSGPGPRPRTTRVHSLILLHRGRQVFLDFEKNKGKGTQTGTGLPCFGSAGHSEKAEKALLSS